MRLIDGDALIAWIKESQHMTSKMRNVICKVETIPPADNEVVGKLKTAIESGELCKNCPTAERISSENLLGAMALGFSYGTNADRPQGEWVDAEIPLESGDTLPIQVCNLCKTFYPLVYTGGGHRFCPNCGARMKGADDGRR